MKSKYPILITLILLILSSCNPYKRISITGSDFYGRNKVIKNIDKYDVYVHEADSVYQVEEATFTEDLAIKGRLTPVDAETQASFEAADTIEKVAVGARDDIHIYLEDDQTIRPEPSSNEIKVTETNVDSVDLIGKEKMGALGIVFTVIFAALLLIILGFIFLITAFVADSSGNGSDSGTSDSDSGCYVATMAYGSYEAPEVLVLRKFRDRFLQKFGAGRAFIKWYYKNSPGFVAKHKSKQWLHSILRKLLNTLVFVLKPIFR